MVKWVACLTCHLSVLSLNPYKDSHCFLEQELIPLMLSTGWYEFNRDFTIKLKYCGSCGRSTQRSNSTFVKYRQNQNQTNRYVGGHYLLKIFHKSQNNDSTLYYTLKLFQACFIWTKRLIYVGQLNEESMTISHNFQKQHDQPLLKPNNPR